MPMTEKLYETNGMISTFRARVLSCEKRADGYAVILDRTAFFPEGGGQSADTGCLSNAQVRDVQIENGEILHFTDLSVSGEITGTLHFDTRFRKMQNHLGEHLLCGAIHRLFGFDNVGFHLGADDMTFDINGILTESQIAEVEKEANRAIWEDAPVRCYTPSPEDLSRLDYRAKAEKISNASAVRIVDVEGFDRCACCAPHLDRAGKIGMIKITDAMKYKGGMRFHAYCGSDALKDYQTRQKEIEKISVLLSVPRERAVLAVQAKLDELAAAKRAAGILRRELVAAKIAQIPPSDTHICLFEPTLDPNGLREMASEGISKTPGIFAVFSGSDGNGYDFVCASEHIPMKKAAAQFAEALGGKCGGSEKMIFGHTDADENQIRRFFLNFSENSTAG